MLVMRERLGKETNRLVDTEVFRDSYRKGKRHLARSSIFCNKPASFTLYNTVGSKH